MNVIGWGSKTVDLLARNLAEIFPDVQGFQREIWKLMRQFAECYPNGIYETAVSQIPLDKEE